MESRALTVENKGDKRLTIRVIPGHFATSHSHVNYYLDITGLKSRHTQAKLAAELLAPLVETPETIVCLDRTAPLAAFLAECKGNGEVCILEPDFNINHQWVFPDNTQPMLWGKKVLLLLASATTGKTLSRARESLNYYGAKVQGIAAVFSAIASHEGLPVASLFGPADLPDYATYSSTDCPFCKKHLKLDALVSSLGYQKL